jgi:hypothetical protein
LRWEHPEDFAEQFHCGRAVSSRELLEQSRRADHAEGARLQSVAHDATRECWLSF